jgi:hypothetical protein
MNKIKHKYNCHKGNAKFRNIGFELTFEEWWDIWQQSGKWEQRGKGAGKYVMARHNDVGPYAVGNVSIKTQEENIREANIGDKNPSKRSGALISAGSIGVPKQIYKCFNCYKDIGGKSNLLRWHNDNCKDKI